MSEQPEKPPHMARRRVVESQTCPSRMEDFGPWERREGMDHWETGRWPATVQELEAEVADFMARNPTGTTGVTLWKYVADLPYGQPRTCSFCGGIHPDDAIVLLRAGWEVETTGKSYKRYLAPPGSRAAHERFIAKMRGFNDEVAALPDGVPIPPRPAFEWEGPASPVPPVKLYTVHFRAEHRAQFNALLEERYR